MVKLGWYMRALLKREAVILPLHIWNHNGDFDCDLVLASTAFMLDQVLQQLYTAEQVSTIRTLQVF